MPVQVAVCGPRECTATQARQAFRVGELLADRDVVVICGGGTGVMAAVAAGVRSRNGVVVGIRPGDSRDGASSDLTAVIVTNMGEARNAIIVASADAVIVVGGSWGTLSELALARRGDIPVVSLGGWMVLDGDGRPLDPAGTATTAEDAVEQALRNAAR